MPASDKEVLEELRPTHQAKIMDLVAGAGIDVRPWAIREDGAPVKNPAANPSYCYEWAFGGGDEPTALCIWHESLAIQKGHIEYVGNSRKDALDLDRAAEDHFKPREVKSRAKEQARRARRFDLLLQRAYRQGKPIRVITLEGEMRRGGSDPGVQSAIVDFRLLDPEPWYVHEYTDNDGSCRLVRGLPSPAKLIIESSPPPFIDQFSIPPAAERVESTGLVYPRSPEVRRNVLRRASGKCECCSAPGFLMGAGGIYLETHHVFPLSFLGPDLEWNVVAICPNDHRRAHFASDKDEIRARLVEQLVSSYPAAKAALQSLMSEYKAP
jgi:5-methylcytosine-specific restriction protein A